MATVNRYPTIISETPRTIPDFNDRENPTQVQVMDYTSEDSDSENDAEKAIEVQNSMSPQPWLNMGVGSGPSQNIGHVAVSNSEHIHFGNKTNFYGPVTIKHFIENRGTENAAYIRTEDENTSFNAQQQVVESIPSENVGQKKIIIRVWQKILLSVFGVALIGAVVALILSLHGKTNQDTADKTLQNQQFSSIYNTSKSDGVPLIIAPNHLRIVSRSEWLAQPVEKPLDRIKHPVPWVIIAHTATESCEVQSECVLHVRLIQNYHVESRGWYDIGYNFLVGGDGSAYYGRGWDDVGAHTKGYNSISMGIAFIGTFNNIAPPQQQLDACKKLIQLGVSLGKIAKDYKLLAHRQLWATRSPGDMLYDILKEWPHFVHENTSIADILPPTPPTPP